MLPFFKREETKEEIVITYKYRAAWYIVLLLFFILTLPYDNKVSEWKSLGVGVLLFILVVWLAGGWNASREINRAARAGKVEISGSRFSFKKPLAFKIKK